jgi:hypothetical protein
VRGEVLLAEARERVAIDAVPRVTGDGAVTADPRVEQTGALVAVVAGDEETSPQTASELAIAERSCGSFPKRSRFASTTSARFSSFVPTTTRGA